MLISELPQPYKALAEKRREEEPFLDKNSNSFLFAFVWCRTEEGNAFWHDCHYAQTESELPPYPYE